MKLSIIFIISFIAGSAAFNQRFFNKAQKSRNVNTKTNNVNFLKVQTSNSKVVPLGRSQSSSSLKAVQIGQLFSSLTPTSAVLGSVIVAVVSSLAIWLRHVLWSPSRTYNKDENSVGREYDAWTTEGILEYYWGEHIHLGYYSKEELEKGYKKKNFIQAKYDFIDEMIKFGGLPENPPPSTILDVGCGIGGTSRYLAKKFGAGTTVTGITISTAQQKRATELAKERGVPNAEFKLMDALNMTFPDNSFDVVWGCESGEHMPDKEKYIQEMTRVLKPGGKLVVATWCQRDSDKVPFNAKERKVLDFLYAEWTHPYFISINDYAKIMEKTGQLQKIITADWVKETIASWRHSIWVGVFDPWPVVIRPKLWWKCLRDGITLERMHNAFNEGLMQYGMLTATKASPVVIEAPAAAAASV